ncbi:hypothetical protein H9L13_05860 [Sphingomonas lutea]|uniref:Uncharacterized protein n=1 Tax=Sphingomonas lutea TaxID=1045317 RepID=A0A7G9SKL1_9SPHN|nr:hypothetical protein [Sphingomonas lutea]QNN68386.1 hypothetical protein H9L13_05860 [Sphingomonas lutea]
MTRWRATLSILAVIAVPGAGQAQSFERHAASDAGSSRPKLDFRLVEEPRYSSRPIHNSGMIAQTSVAPNAAIGIGLFKSSQRKLDAGEWRVDGRASGSRKAAVRFSLKF